MLMAWMKTKNDNPQEQTEIVEAIEKKPPTNLTDFLAAEGLEDWPLPMSFEKPLDNQSDGLLMGKQDDIAAILNEVAPLKFHLLEELEKKLTILEANLNVYADQIVTTDKRPCCHVDYLFQSPSRTFVTEMPESCNAQSIEKSKGQKNVSLVDLLHQTQQRSLDILKFPGFVQGQLIELPGQLEALHILNCVTGTQKFNPGFKKFWKKIFLSEASAAVMQDLFWWIFLDRFSKETDLEEKDLLFDRIADSYTALFTSINADVKDKFLSVYPDCLAQALYCVYKEAFPESKCQFDEEFKQYLVNLTHEWVTGLRSVPGTWKTWSEEGLKLVQMSRDDETAKNMLEAAGISKKVDLSLDMDSFTDVIDQLGVITPNLYREHTKTTGTKFYPSNVESHQMGPGPEYERVKFNTSGRSPLISHYLHLRQLRSDKQPGMKVKRTEIRQFPPEGPTYQQFIASSLNKYDYLNKEYTRICEQTAGDILDLNRQQRDTNRKINRLKKALTNAKNVQERDFVMEEIFNFKDSLLKGISIVEHTPSQAESKSSESSDEDD